MCHFWCMTVISLSCDRLSHLRFILTHGTNIWNCDMQLRSHVHVFRYHYLKKFPKAISLEEICFKQKGVSPWALLGNSQCIHIGKLVSILTTAFHIFVTEMNSQSNWYKVKLNLHLYPLHLTYHYSTFFKSKW